MREAAPIVSSIWSRSVDSETAFERRQRESRHSRSVSHVSRELFQLFSFDQQWQGKSEKENSWTRPAEITTDPNFHAWIRKKDKETERQKRSKEALANGEDPAQFDDDAPAPAQRGRGGRMIGGYARRGRSRGGGGFRNTSSRGGGASTSSEPTKRARPAESSSEGEVDKMLAGNSSDDSRTIPCVFVPKLLFVTNSLLTTDHRPKQIPRCTIRAANQCELRRSPSC